MVLGGGEGSLWAVPPAGVQEAEFLLGVWGKAGVLMPFCAMVKPFS